MPGHASHSSVPPLEYSPAPHAAQALDPSPALVPVGHRWHVEELVALTAADEVPLEQLVHVPATPSYGESSYVPAGQGRQPSELPVAKKPASHRTQAEDPVFAAYPWLQGLHSNAPPAESEYVPALHGRQPHDPLRPTVVE